MALSTKYPVGTTWNMETPAVLFSMSTFLRRPVSCKIKETHQYRTILPEYTLEAGSEMEEHTVAQPMRVMVEFEMANIGRGPEAGGMLLFELQTWLNAGETFFLYTDHIVYAHMAISNIQATHSAPNKGKLTFKVELFQTGYFRRLTQSNFTQYLNQTPVQTLVQYGDNLPNSTEFMIARSIDHQWYGYKGDLLGYRANDVDSDAKELQSPINSGQLKEDELRTLDPKEQTEISMARIVAEPVALPDPANPTTLIPNPVADGPMVIPGPPEKEKPLKDPTKRSLWGKFMESLDQSSGDTYNKVYDEEYMAIRLAKESLMEQGYTEQEAQKYAELKASLAADTYVLDKVTPSKFSIWQPIDWVMSKSKFSTEAIEWKQDVKDRIAKNQAEISKMEIKVQTRTNAIGNINDLYDQMDELQHAEYPYYGIGTF